MKKLLVLGLIGVALCSCGKDEGKKVEEKKVEKKESETKIFTMEDVGVDERKGIVDRKNELSITGKLKVNASKGQNYILYTVKDGILNGEVVIMDKNNKQIGYGNYLNGKKNGKFKFSLGKTTVEAEYKDDKQVGNYNFSYIGKDIEIEYTLKDKYIEMYLTDNRKRKTIPIKGEVLSQKDKTTLEIRAVAGKNQNYQNSYIRDVSYLPIDDIFGIKTRKNP